MINFPKSVKSTKCDKRSQTDFKRDRHGLTRDAVSIENRWEEIEVTKKRGGWRTGARG